MKAQAALLAVALTFLCGCQGSKPLPQPPQAVKVQMVSGSPESSGQTRYSAVVLPETQVPMLFRVPGYVTSLLRVKGGDGRLREVAEGDHVSRGTVLAQLRAAEYQDKFRQATAQHDAASAGAEKAKLDFERAERLFASQSLTKPEYDAARAQYDATKAQVRGAEALKAEANVALGDTRLVAPLSGEVVKKSIEVGSLVGSSTLAFVVADTDHVKIIVGVPDVVLPTLKLGQPVEITTEALPNRTFHARITRMASAADSKTRNFEVEIAIPNPDHALRAGMVASVELSAPGTQPAGPLAPLSAIVQTPGGGYGVFVVQSQNGGSVARFRAVELGEVYGNQIAVTKGVSAGDIIITTGASVLKDGQAVEVLR